jgi:hypothetical protein
MALMPQKPQGHALCNHRKRVKDLIHLKTRQSARLYMLGTRQDGFIFNH